MCSFESADQIWIETFASQVGALDPLVIILTQMFMDIPKWWRIWILSNPSLLYLFQKPIEFSWRETVFNPDELLHDFFQRNKRQALQHSYQPLCLVSQMAFSKTSPCSILPERLCEVELARYNSSLRKYYVDWVQQCEFKVSRHKFRFELKPVFLTYIFYRIQTHNVCLRVFTLH